MVSPSPPGNLQLQKKEKCVCLRTLFLFLTFTYAQGDVPNTLKTVTEQHKTNERNTEWTPTQKPIHLAGIT